MPYDKDGNPIDEGTPLHKKYPKATTFVIGTGAGLTALGAAKLAGWAAGKVSSSTEQQTSKVMGAAFALPGFRR